MHLFRDLEERRATGRGKADEGSGGVCLFFFIIWFGQEMRASHDWKQLWDDIWGKNRTEVPGDAALEAGPLVLHCSILNLPITCCIAFPSHISSSFL